MERIDRNTIQKDLEVIRELTQKYSNAIYERQDGQKGHFDNQPKLVQIAIINARSGLQMAMEALVMLYTNREFLIEDQ